MLKIDNYDNYEFIESVGHHHFAPAGGPRHLVIGPTVPEGEEWTLTLIAAKNNMESNSYPTQRSTAELSVCVYLPPRPTDHEDSPPGNWLQLNGDINVPQFLPVRWTGHLSLRPGSRLGAWFRGANEGDSLELNAIYDVEKEKEKSPSREDKE